MLKEKNNKNKELPKKRCLLLASNWPSQSCWSFWLQQAEGGLVSLFSVPDGHLASLQPSSPAASGPTGSGAHSPQGYRCEHGAFRGTHFPRCLRCGLGPCWCTLSLGPPAWAWGLPHHCGNTTRLGWEEAGEAAAGEFPKLPLSVSFFHSFFLRNFSCSILPLHTRKSWSSHTAHLSS